MNKVLYTAAHSGFNLGEVPLGGGAAVCQHLAEEWTKTKPFEWEVLGPALIGPGAPRQKDLVRYSELAYARFCARFEKKVTEMILQRDPHETVVLSNDVSEGPDFALLASQGYPLFTIFHVDVVDYFTAIYLKGFLKPESTTSFFRAMNRCGLSWILPNMLHLIWQKQEDSVRVSRGLIVPSERMKEVLLREYPGVDKDKIHVLPWGAWGDPASAEEIAREKERLLEQYPAPEGSFVLLTLSRISPEKGQDRLLKALGQWENQPDFPREGISLYLAGEPAYMMGKRYDATLRNLAARLKRCRVHFVGYISGARKKALFALCDLYVFPSRHESYGLTLLEALREGCPVLATPSHGAHEVFQSNFGEMVGAGPEDRMPDLLLGSLKRLLGDRSQLKRMGEAARAWAGSQAFSRTAAELAYLLKPARRV